MSLEKNINEEIKRAMLSKDKRRLEALRAIKAALLMAKTGKDTSSGEIPEEVELQLLQKLVKQRKESTQIYLSQNRHDLADDEIFQAEIIESFLPKQVSVEEISEIIKSIIASCGASGIKDMGKVMGLATKEIAGRSDNKTISAIVKDLLA